MFTDVDGPARPTLVLSFLIVAPGLAWARWLRLRDPVVVATVAVTLSLSLDTLVACGMLYGGFWSPRGSFVVLAAITVAGVAATLGHRRTAPTPEALP